MIRIVTAMIAMAFCAGAAWAQPAAQPASAPAGEVKADKKGAKKSAGKTGKASDYTHGFWVRPRGKTERKATKPAAKPATKPAVKTDPKAATKDGLGQSKFEKKKWRHQAKKLAE